MVEVINPKVQIVGFGPYADFSESGNSITPDEFVHGAARVTYKDLDVLNEMVELKKDNPEFSQDVTNALVRIAGAGHASMATTPGFWGIIGGNSSKLIDSLFTGAKFSSSLMPSSRRVPITLDSIVIPKGIEDKGDKERQIYLETSERNIQTYLDLQERGVPTQEASKIVQYGHKGGGFIFMPLETLIYFSKDFDSKKGSGVIPQEGYEIVSQFEEAIREMGAGTTYDSRKAAPRTGCVNPEIFHERNNLAQDVIEINPEVLEKSIMISEDIIKSKGFEKSLNNYLELRRDILSSKNGIKERWPELLRRLEEIVGDYNDAVSFKVASNIPWRVWGEVKRHRTLPQTTESVYNAVDRAWMGISSFGHLENKSTEQIISTYGQFVSLPASVKRDRKNLLNWTNAFRKSIKDYHTLITLGVEKSDAIAIIPRGLKMGNIKDFDLYNLTTGYGSLRLCASAEPEMRQITSREMALVKKSLKRYKLGDKLSEILGPKCYSTGFCPETKMCNSIKKLVPFYEEKLHKQFNSERMREIRENLK